MQGCDYRLLQLTNSSIGAVAAAAFMPLGTVTRQVKQSNSCQPTFVVSNSTNNTVYIQEPGIYKVTYNGFLTVAAADTIILDLQVNGTTVATANVTAAAAGTFAVPLTFTIRVFNNCNCNTTNLPAQIQLLNNGSALTGGNSNLIIERVYNGC